MNNSIIVSIAGDTVTITEERYGNGIPMSRGNLFYRLRDFIGQKPVFFRTSKPQRADYIAYEWAMHKLFEENASFIASLPKPEPVNWEDEIRLHFGLSAQVEAANCHDCGRLVQDSGLCSHCADRKAGFRR